MSMPSKDQHESTKKARKYIPGTGEEARLTKYATRDRPIAEAISKIVQVVGSAEVKAINRVKRQKEESDTFSKLHDEYLQLHAKTSDLSLPPFLQRIHKVITARVEDRLTNLAKAPFNKQHFNDEDENGSSGMVSRSTNRSVQGPGNLFTEDHANDNE